MANSYSGTMPQPARHPLTAAILSIVPGLGQLYVGDKRKGILFLDVAVINYILLVVMCWSAQITMALRSFANEYRFNLNFELVNALEQAHLGSPASMFMLSLMILFVLYAARDAYDKAFGIKRKQIYGDSFIDFSEATSGSYLGHVALMLACLVLAAFFVQPPTRIVERSIIFDLEQATPISKLKPLTEVRSQNNHERHGRKAPEKPKIAENRPRTEPVKEKAVENKPPAPTAVRPTPAPIPAPPAPTAVRPTPAPTPAPPAPTATRPTLSPKAYPAINTAGSAFQPPGPQRLLASAALPPVPHAGPMGALMPVSVALTPAAGGRTAAGLPSAPMPIATTLDGPFNASRGLPNALPFTGFGSGPRAAGFGSGHRLGAVIPEGAVAPLPVGAASGSGIGGSGSVAPNIVPVKTHTGGGSTVGGTGTGPSPIRFKSGQPGEGGSFMVAPSGTPGRGTSATRGETTNPSKDSDDKEASEATRREVDWSGFMADLQRRIKKSWFPPRHSENLRAVATFTLHTDGSMTNLKVIHSGGLTLYDDAALKAVQSAMPFRHLPAGAPESVDIEFTFDFNVFNSPSR